MNNMDCVVGTLARHREARMWDDGVVATDLLAQLGLKPDGDAKNAIIPPDPDVMAEDEVVALEAAAKEATDKATAARQAIAAKAADEAKAKADEAAANAKAAQAARDAAAKPAATVTGA